MFYIRLHTLGFVCGSFRRVTQGRLVSGVRWLRGGFITAAVCDNQAKWKTYYLLLTIPGHPENCLQEILNNPQTHRDYLEMYHRLNSASTEAECKKIQKETGIKHPSIFALLPYFDIGHAILGGCMHAIYINLFKALIKLWCREFKGLDTGNGHYIIPAPM